MILIIKVIKILIIAITIGIITLIIKCRGRYRTSLTTNTELLVTLYNDRKPLTNIKKSCILDAVWVLYTPPKRLIRYLT